jgi:hypothetical protein
MKKRIRRIPADKADTHIQVPNSKKNYYMKSEQGRNPRIRRIPADKADTQLQVPNSKNN